MRKRNPIPIPEGVKVEVQDNIVTIEGKKGRITQAFKNKLKIKIDNNSIVVELMEQTREAKALYGTAYSLITNMLIGVDKGFEKSLQIVGQGYKAEIDGKNLKMKLGYSHPILYEPPEGIKLSTPNPQEIVVSGIDKQLVGEVAATIRAFKKPDPYKGKGIRYKGEHVRHKAGKRAIT